MNMPTFDNQAMHRLFDDMYTLDTGKWASVDDSATGTNTANDTAGGEVSIVTAAADNDYHLMASTKKAFKFAANKPLWAEMRFSLTEAATSAANLIFGVCSITTTGILADNGAGPATTYDGATIYKVDGTMTLKGQVSKGSTQSSLSLCTFTSGSTYRVGFHFDPGDGTNGRVNFYVYDETAGVLYNSTKNSQDFGLPIVITSAGAMYAVYGVKAGGANAETLKVDYVDFRQLR
jgi:hypothetical protein